MTRTEDKPDYDSYDDDDLRTRFNSYNPDKDSNGSIGLALAEAAMKRCGYDYKKVQQWANSTRDSIEKATLERIARAALTRFSELEAGERIHGREIAQKLSAIRNAGYSVPAYSHLSRDEQWKLLRQIRSSVGKEVREKYPEIARAIEQENQRRIDEAEFCR